MKKMMLAVTIACAAAMSQAAVTKWGSSDKIYCGETIQSGATVQLFLVGDGVDYLIDTRDVASSGMPANIGKLTSNIGNQTVSYGENTIGEDQVTITASSKVYAKIISLDGKYEQITEQKAIDGLTPTQLGSVTFVFGSTISETQTAGKWTAVAPEPTSAMLMLIGFAGLALRRRRA